MRFCCRDMATLMRSGIVRIGCPIADNLSGPHVDDLVIKADGDWLFLKSCPFCGQELKVEFDKED